MGVDHVWVDHFHLAVANGAKHVEDLALLVLDDGDLSHLERLFELDDVVFALNLVLLEVVLDKL